MDISEHLINVVDLAHYLNMSTGMIYKLVRANSIPYLRIESMLKFDKRDIDAWKSQKKSDTSRS